MSCGSMARLIAAMAASAGRAVLGQQVLHLALAHAVLAGAGAVHGQRPLDQALGQILGALDLVGVVHVDQQREMEIAVADMADDRRQQCRLAAMSACVSVTHSASREIGTQTSVAIICAPGRSAKFDSAA